MDDFVFLSKRGGNHVLKKFKVRRVCTVPSPVAWLLTEKSDGSEMFATTGSLDGSNILPVFWYLPAHGHHTEFIYWGSLTPIVAAERGQSLTSNNL